MAPFRRKALVGSTLGLAVGVTMTVMPPAAQAGPSFSNVQAHRHFLVTPDGSRHAFGPQVCGRPELQDAFNRFHTNVHVGEPRDAMSHPHNPASIVAGPC